MRARRRKRAMRAGSWLAVFIVIAGVGGLVVGALHGRASAAARPTVPEPRPVSVAPAVQQAAPRKAPAPASRPSAVVQRVSSQLQPPLVPMLALGQTTISDGITATRSDSGITVLFDTQLMRTRRPEKFERVVRETLPAIYGKRADSVLATVPAGTFATQGDLLTELPTRGVHLTLGDGWKLAVFPETRPGRDGPLVVRYRVAVVQ